MGSARRPRVLFVAPCIPGVEGVGWAKRAYSILSGYLDVSDVDLVVWDTDGSGHLCNVRELEERCASVRILRRQDVMDWFAVYLPQILARVDAAHLSRALAIAELAAATAPTLPLLFDLDECPLAVSRRFEASTSLLNDESELEAARKPDPQRIQALLAKCARTFVASDLEARRAGDCRSIRVIHNSVPTMPLRPRRAQGPLLFVGNLDFFPNEHGVRRFANEILPAIRSARPDVEALAVGTHRGRSALPTSMDTAVNVPSVDPYYERASVCIVPIWFGGGTRIKILEAFSHSAPVVSTEVGCEGLDVEHGRHLLIANGSDDFARACLRLMREPDLVEHLVRNARDLLLERYSFESARALARHELLSVLPA